MELMTTEEFCNKVKENLDEIDALNDIIRQYKSRDIPFDNALVEYFEKEKELKEKYNAEFMWNGLDAVNKDAVVTIPIVDLLNMIQERTEKAQEEFLKKNIIGGMCFRASADAYRSLIPKEFLWIVK